jgi:hypothetical protein
VVELLPNNEARVIVLHSIKTTGARELRLRASSPASSLCGTHFSLGEEFIYLVRSEPLTLCDKLPPTEAMRRAIAELLGAWRNE